MRFAFLLAALAGITAWAQAPTAEITTKEAAPTFKSGTNLVPVPVVVRDRNGRAVGNLGIEDFQLLDNGKPQIISKFSVEKLVKDAAASASGATQATSGDAPGNPGSDGIPSRFIAYLFDDLHLTPADLIRTRDAARLQIDGLPKGTQRAAIYTTSGIVMQEFTGDPDKLHTALASIGTGHASATKTMEQTGCPPMTYYMGYEIYEKGDAQALAIAVADTMVCANLTPQQRAEAVKLAQNAARVADLEGQKDSESSLEMLRNLVARLASMPGQRSLVVISDGFLVTDDRTEEQTGLIERAIRANVLIGSLDARGLFQSSVADASELTVNTATLAQRSIYRNTEAMIQSDILANLADGTGGIFYHGLNDYHEGLERTAATPDYLYVLGFSPIDLKLDGRYHNLKITLKTVKGMEIQARKGYYAPKYGTNPADQAKQQIEESFFSRDEVRDLPAILQTQYFKDDNGDVTLSTIAKIDIKKLPFRKDAGRNADDLTVVTGLFDNDGNYVTGIQKIVQMKLLDATIEKLGASGISLKNTFAVHTGRYMVRMVVRDSEGELMSAQSGLVEIP
jgi:VWFA-related protein